MCTYATETIPPPAAPRAPAGWFAITDATVYFDHPVHAMAGHTLNIDFRAPADGPSARVAVELTAETAERLAHAILAALESAPAALKVG